MNFNNEGKPFSKEYCEHALQSIDKLVEENFFSKEEKEIYQSLICCYQFTSTGGNFFDILEERKEVKRSIPFLNEILSKIKDADPSLKAAVDEITNEMVEDNYSVSDQITKSFDILNTFLTKEKTENPPKKISVGQRELWEFITGSEKSNVLNKNKHKHNITKQKKGENLVSMTNTDGTKTHFLYDVHSKQLVELVSKNKEVKASITSAAKPPSKCDLFFNQFYVSDQKVLASNRKRTVQGELKVNQTEKSDYDYLMNFFQNKDE